MEDFGTLTDPSARAVGAMVILVLGVLRLSLRRERFYLLVLGSALSLGTVEAICRLAGLGSPATPTYDEDRAREGIHPYRAKGRLTWTYPDDPRAYFGKSNRIVASINSLGFRGPERPRVKSPGTFRIAFLGDSFTLGVGVRDEGTLPAVVERELRADHGSVESLNFGVTGTDTPQQIRLLEDYVVSFNPDLVAIVLFLNDTRRTATIDFLSRPGHFGRIRKYSWFLNLLVARIERGVLHEQMIRHYRDGFREDNPGWQAVRAALRAGNSLAGDYGFQLVTVLLPAPATLLRSMGFDYGLGGHG